MRYYKIINNGYIVSIGTGTGGTQISAAEYDKIMSVIHDKPATRDGYDYWLKIDLRWEEHERPPIPEDEKINAAEAFLIIFGSESEMTRKQADKIRDWIHNTISLETIKEVE